MTQTIPTRRRLLSFFTISVLLLAVACQKKEPVPETLPPMERAVPETPVGTTQTVLRKTFSLKTTATFPFDIPAHAVRPHLHGIFVSFAGEVHGASDETANVDFLIFNEEEYGDFQENRPSESLMSVESSHNQAVNFDLPASLDRPVKYYLFFRSSSGSTAKKVVQADFHVEF
jgi:hypothetical protein